MNALNNDEGQRDKMIIINNLHALTRVLKTIDEPTIIRINNIEVKGMDKGLHNFISYLLETIKETKKTGWDIIELLITIGKTIKRNKRYFLKEHKTKTRTKSCSGLIILHRLSLYGIEALKLNKTGRLLRAIYESRDAKEFIKKASGRISVKINPSILHDLYENPRILTSITIFVDPINKKVKLRGIGIVRNLPPFIGTRKFLRRKIFKEIIPKIKSTITEPSSINKI